MGENAPSNNIAAQHRRNGIFDHICIIEVHSLPVLSKFIKLFGTDLYHLIQ